MMIICQNKFMSKKGDANKLLYHFKIWKIAIFRNVIKRKKIWLTGMLCSGATDNSSQFDDYFPLILTPNRYLTRLFGLSLTTNIL